MIARDESGIIVQHPSMDGGDSAARTGISALVYELDQENLHKFVTFKHEIVRHPHQQVWNDSTKTSRDQVVQFMASEGPFITADHYRKKWFINKDFLMPDVKLYIWKKSGDNPPLWLKLLGTACLWLSMIWNTKVKPWEELNQFCCICINFGPKWIRRLYQWHPDIEKNIRDYWSGWRDQPEIGNILIGELRRLKALAHFADEVPLS